MSLCVQGGLFCRREGVACSEHTWLPVRQARFLMQSKKWRRSQIDDPASHAVEERVLPRS